MSDRMPDNNLHLPQDLAMEILTKLPVKSLVRFKCVSKSWKNLFKTPSFVSKQLSASSVNHKHNPLLIVSEYEDSYESNRPTSLCLKLYPNGNPSSNLYTLLAESVIRIDGIYGPCNGILCLDCQDFLWRLVLILWNPATREVKVLPPFLCPRNGHCVAYGFGIDPKTNDYKIVKLLFPHSHLDSRQSTTAEVYNLTTDSWRIINDIIPASYVYDNEVNRYTNGVYYWMAEDGFDKIILRFDMSSETFERIKAPLTEISLNDDDDDVYCGDSIFMINDRIFYYSRYKNSYRTLYEGAVMNEDSRAERSWAKVSFTLHHERPGRPENFLTGIYHCWKDDEIIISMEPSEELLYDEDRQIIGTFQPYQGFLASYKIDGSELRMVQKIEVNLRKLTWLREYMESIVPLTI